MAATIDIVANMILVVKLSRGTFIPSEGMP